MKKSYSLVAWIVVSSFITFSCAEANPIPVKATYVSMSTEDMEITIGSDFTVDMQGEYSFDLVYHSMWNKFIDQSMVHQTGTIRYIDIEGGFYGIIGSDGKNYEPVNLRPEFQLEGKEVTFTAEIHEEIESIYMWGTPVEVSMLHDGDVFQWHCTMYFPAPPDATDIKVYKDEEELNWDWTEEIYNTTINDLVEDAPLELQEWPMFGWNVDVYGNLDEYGSFGNNFTITVNYTHNLVDVNDEGVLMYSLGTGRYNQGWNAPMPGIGASGKPFVDVNISVTYPSSIFPKAVSPQEDDNLYNPSVSLDPEILWSAWEIAPQNDFIVLFRERCSLTKIKPESIKAGIFLPRMRIITITDENSNFNSTSEITFNGHQENAIRILFSYAPNPDELVTLVIVPAGIEPGDYEVSVTTGDEVCTGISLIIE